MTETEVARAKSTTAIGNEMRDAVAALLRTKYVDLEVERLIGGKQVDIVYKEYRYGRMETIGVECKCYTKSLTAQFLSKEIFAEYRPLLASRALDCLLIVGSRSLGSAARERLRVESNMRYLTYEELEEDLLGIRPYVTMLSTLFNAEGLSSYYVETRFEDESKAASEFVRGWLDEHDSPPLAVLGGYGQGKTSLAIRLIADQARRYLANPAERIPILIRLGQVVHETTLEGLFGREFTSRVRSRYHFETFRHLNEAGRLFIVLDGFDEMKHGMKASDFRANFAEFNRLLCVRSKVILLGRPSAFSSDTRRRVLAGRQMVGGVEVAVPGMRRWEEKTVALFSEDEIDSFLRGYMLHLVDCETQKGLIRKENVDDRINEIRHDISLELLARPVHTRIVAELAVNPSFNFKGFTEHDLYSQFIKQILERDADQKRARKHISIDDRMKFQARLAHWAWTRPNQAQGSFLRDEIPNRLMDGLGDGDTEDDEAKLNEYIVSTVTDQKEGGYLYFSHRSFQEFLVAEYLRSGDALKDIDHERQSRFIDEAVASYLMGAPSTSYLLSWFETLPYGYPKLSSLYLSIFLQSVELIDVLRSRFADLESTTAAQVAMLGMALISGRIKGQKEIEESRRWLETIASGGAAYIAAAAYHFLLRLYKDRSTMLPFLRMAMRDRPARLLNRMRDQDHVASALILGPDPIIDTTLGALDTIRRGRRSSLVWNIDQTYKSLTRLIRSGGGLELEDAPQAFERLSELPAILEVSKEEFEEATSMDFDDAIEVANKKRDPRKWNVQRAGSRA